MTSIHFRSARPRRSPRVALLSATAGLAMVGASPALAECVTQVDGVTVICSGENSDGQTVNTAGAAVVTTTPGFSIDSAGSALVIRGFGAVSYDDANALSLIARGGDGLLVVNNGSAGRVSIRTGADITGSDRGLLVNNLGNGGIRIESTGTVSGGVRGISALAVANIGPSANDDIEIIANNASGEVGVGTENRGGNGSIRITSTGTASATIATGFGISAFNSVAGAGRDIVIEANNIGGVGGGINSTNRGIGSTSITVNGTVNVSGRQGITATNAASATDLSVITNGTVTSGATSITILNEGTGDTAIIARAQLTSNNLMPEASPQSGNGINVFNGAAARNIVVAAAGVEGRAGILINNGGLGTTSLTATGLIKGRDGRGVEITTGIAAGDIAVQLAAVEGATDGVVINPAGNGDIDLTVTGPVVAGGDGVRIERASGTTGDTMVAVGDVTGGQNGVLLLAEGTGQTSINATGTLTGTDRDGLFASGSGPILLDLDNSNGAHNGVTLNIAGAGDGHLVSRGTATGGASGVRAATTPGATGSLSLDVNNASGGDFGVSILTGGTGGGDGGGESVDVLRTADIGIAAINADAGFGTTLITRGTVEGGIAAIDAVTESGLAFRLTNDGTIRNRSGASGDLAIQAAGGPVDILNNGALLGTIRLDAGIVAPEPEPEPEDPGDDETRGRSARAAFVIAEVPDIEASHRFTNAGTWNSIGGVNVFGGVDDVLVNVAGGRLFGGAAAATAETTTYSGLETLTNQGIVTMADGGFGDVVQTSGDATFAAGSLLAVDAGGSGSDRFVAGGATVIETGARLQVSNPQPAVLGTRYTVLESAGGVTGSFTFADQLLSNFLGYRQGRTDTTIFVELAKLRAFASAGMTPNQIAVGTALDGQAASDPLAAATLLLPSDAAAQAAFDGLSGEIHPSVRTAMIEESRLPRNAVLERLDERTGSAVWGQLFGNWGDSDGANGTGDLDRKTIGGVLGADFAVGDRATIGIAGSYLETDVDARARSSSAKLKSWHVLGYAGVQVGGASLKVGGGYASASIDTDRAVAFPGIGQRLVADYDGSVIHGFADLGYRLPLGTGHVEPFAQIVAVRADTDAFAETGGSAAVAGAKARENATLSTLGARFSTSTDGRFSVGGMAGWQHGFGDLTPATAMRFTTGPGFAVIGTRRSRDAGVATIDARLRLSGAAQITVSYDGVIGSAGQDHSVKAGLRIAF
ncbi:hypothetical protein BWQ93_16880 [Sphingopyxis sp. QXT-31]|uniref:autotransporter domain-containing protein n=1 Tax=Sphingopyxis sp. QXT-31 TaxID=1357916 RepID=UPI0009792AFD|nr:autotransporter domain-containing protein [Sphingopyxis sp. QXT-31]APZ99970.1 hypothetical protein BWQ93_16880 [Sphingopyxis sp. QXT-31]